MSKRATEIGEGSEPSKEDFAALFAESLNKMDIVEGAVVKGKVIGIENDMALIDVGLKSEGRVMLKEFAVPGQPADLKIGDSVEVFVERLENINGEAVLSREKARHEEGWTLLEKAFKENARVGGVIYNRVKGGFTVNLSGVTAFLPGSQVDVRPVRDIGPLMSSQHEFYILKMDRHRGNIVVSRRAVLEEARAEARAELISNLKEGQMLDGVVKNITDYGAFVDLGGVDGLLHVTDIAWRRINHPSEALSIGQNVKVLVIRFNPETHRISLGMKQLEADPWEGVDAKYPVDARFTGRVTNITDYGAFVELEPGVEGLVHITEMSWTKKNVHPGKIVSTSQQVDVMVLDVDPQKRRISLGLKQCRDNPWQAFLDTHPAESEIEGQVKNITEFGLFVGVTGEIDGMVHMSDVSWEKTGEAAVQDYKKGDRVRVKILEVDVEKERISLGIKQLRKDPFSEVTGGLKRGEQVTCKVTAIQDNGIEVSVNGVTGFIRKGEISRDRADQRSDRFAVDEKVDAKVTSVDRSERRVLLSIKALEVEEERRAMAEYGSSDSGASLGEILGAAINKATKDKGETKEEGGGEAEGGEEETAEAEAEPTDAAPVAEAAPETVAEVAPETVAEAKDKAAKPKEKAAKSKEKAKGKKDDG